MSAAPAPVGAPDAPPTEAVPVAVVLPVPPVAPDPPQQPTAEAPAPQQPARPPTISEQHAEVLRTIFWTVINWFAWLWKDDTDDNYENDPDYQAAMKHYRELKLQEEVEYDTVVAFAKEMFGRYDTTDKSLDEKADAVIKYLGGGSALITITALLGLKTDTANAMIVGIVAMFCLIPSFVAGIFAIVYAIRSRRPRAFGGFPKGEWAFKMADHYKKKTTIEIVLWLILMPACEAAHFRHAQKAKLVRRAHKCYMWAIILLLVPLIGSATALISMLPK